MFKYFFKKLMFFQYKNPFLLRGRYCGSVKIIKMIFVRFFYYTTLLTTFKSRCGYDLDLKDPKGFCEKIQWLKVYYQSPLMNECADKFAVRKHLLKKGLGKYLNDLYGAWDKSEDIDFEKLPCSFVLKSNNGYGNNYICKDKKTIDTRLIRQLIDAWLAEDFYHLTGETVYRNIKSNMTAVFTN